MAARGEPVFTRKDLAKILNVTPLTIANREKRSQYPEPRRDLNGYRIYSLGDVIALQILTFERVDPNPIISVLYDKGYRDTTKLAQITEEINKRRGTV